MELRHLRYFVAVAEEENVTKAAAKLRVAQPAISRQIHDLEEELGVPLFERSARALRLTEAGRIFLGEAQAVLDRAAKAVDAVRGAALGLSGELHVGYAPSVTAYVLPKALRAFQPAFPGMRILLHDLSTQEMVSGVDDGSLSLALSVRPTRDQLRGLRFHPLAEYPLVAAMARAHRFARRKSLSLDEIKTESLVVYTRAEYPEYHAMLKTLFPASVQRSLDMDEHESFSSLIAAVEAGRGLALVPNVIRCMAGSRLKVVALAEDVPPISIGAICRAKESSIAAERFVHAAGAGK